MRSKQRDEHLGRQTLIPNAENLKAGTFDTLLMYLKVTLAFLLGKDRKFFRQIAGEGCEEDMMVTSEISKFPDAGKIQPSQ